MVWQRGSLAAETQVAKTLQVWASSRNPFFSLVWVRAPQWDKQNITGHHRFDSLTCLTTSWPSMTPVDSVMSTRQAVAGQLGRYSHQSWWPKTEMTTSFVESYSRIGRVGFVKKMATDRLFMFVCDLWWFLFVSWKNTYQMLLCWATPLWTMPRLQGSGLLDYQHLTVDAVEPNNISHLSRQQDRMNMTASRFMQQHGAEIRLWTSNPFPYVESLFS